MLYMYIFHEGASSSFWDYTFEKKNECKCRVNRIFGDSVSGCLSTYNKTKKKWIHLILNKIPRRSMVYIYTSVCSKIKMKSNKKTKADCLNINVIFVSRRNKWPALAAARFSIVNGKWPKYIHTQVLTNLQEAGSAWIHGTFSRWDVCEKPQRVPPFSFSFCSYGQPGLAVMNNSCIYRYTCLNSWPHKKLVATAYKPFAWWKIMVTVRCHAHLFHCDYIYLYPCCFVWVLPNILGFLFFFLVQEKCV